jgi:uncharacterized repeat protein (TIGR02543 family)
MKNTIKVSGIIALVAIIGFTTIACDNPVNIKTYTVTYNANGASGTVPTPQKAEAGSTIYVAGQGNLTYSGRNFNGWNTNSTGTGIDYVAGSSLKVDADVTLYAKWNTVAMTTFTVTFESNGGSSVQRQTVNSGATATRPINPTRSGYTFDNWYSNSGLTTVYSFSTPVTANITLYAKWNATAATKYTVTYNANGGSGTVPAAQTVNAGSAITLAGGSSLTRTGYTFGGWNTNASGTGTTYGASTSYTPSSSITLYAKWNAAAATTYTVTYNANGGDGTVPATQTVNAGSAVTLADGSELTKSGYTFSGWNTDASGSGTTFEAGTLYTPSGSITLYAKWHDLTAATYTVSYNTNGGDGATPDEQTVDAGSTITLDDGSGLTKSGYTFGGWNTDASGTGDNYSAGSSYTPSGSITLYAEWNPVSVTTYTVDFDSNGGSAVPSQSVISGATATRPANPTRNGFNFDNWYSDTGLTDLYDFSTPISENITLYARWDVEGTPIPVVNAAAPVINAQPQGGNYFQNRTLSVTASVTDGGTLSYQWYKNAANSVSGGTAIAGATNLSLALSDTGTYYCYVVVTNFIADNGDGGTKTAQTASSVAAVTVEAVQDAWARTISAASSSSSFAAAAVDSFGNVYAAGSQYNNGSFSYGTGVSAQGSASGSGNMILGNATLVKYNPNGTAQWARTVSAGNNDSRFSAVAVDSSGNVYAAGYQRGTGTYTYGAGVSAQGPSSVYNAVLVKYNSSGTAQWARTVSAGSRMSGFSAVAVDSSGNVYVAGSQNGIVTYTYGMGVSIEGTSSSDNVVLVKYDSNGTAQWARTVNAGNNDSRFSAVAVDSSGNVYAAGYQRGTGTYTYGAGVSTQGTYSNSNAVLVKYNPNGTAQWARTVSAGNNDSSFSAVAVDSSGSVYTAGQQYGTGSYTYGAGVSAQGTFSGYNAVLVKYISSGAAQWARTVSAGSNHSSFSAVAVNSSGSVYAAGYQHGTGSYTYGTGVSSQGAYSGGNNVALVKYNSNGTAQWARTVSAGPNASSFNAVTADFFGSVYAAGSQYGNGRYTYDTGATAQGNTGDSERVVLVKYKE